MVVSLPNCTVGDSAFVIVIESLAAQPDALVTSTQYKPAAVAVIDAVVADVLHK